MKKRHSFLARAAMMLLLAMFTTVKAWAWGFIHEFQVDNDYAENEVGHYYVKMASGGSYKLELNDANVTAFKVYDDGGKGGIGLNTGYATGGNYNNNSGESNLLCITAPSGYRLKLSGSIITEANSDKLTVYDNDEAEGTKLIDRISGTVNDIDIISSGQSLTLQFTTDKSVNYDGLDLTVKLYKATDLQFATITGVNSSYPFSGSPIDITPIVNDGNGNPLTLGTDFTATLGSVDIPSFPFSVTPGDYTLTITGTGTATSGYFGSQTISFFVESCPEGLLIDEDIAYGTAGHNYVNMPETGSKTVTFSDANVKAFKVYDNGGKDAEAKTKQGGGFLFVNAPEEYNLRISGDYTLRNGSFLHVFDDIIVPGDIDWDKILIQINIDQPVSANFPTVTSTGKNITIFYGTADHYCNFDMTVSLVPVTYTITYTNAENGTDGVTNNNPTTYTIESDAITLNNPSKTGYTFMGWTFEGQDEPTLTATITAGSIGDKTFTAHWQKNVLTLLDDDSEVVEKNASVIGNHANDGNVYEVTLSGRTLYKDGAWNTLCLPFDVTIADSPLKGDNVVAKVLNAAESSLDSNGKLTLKFTDAPATIPAGTPFIIKWDNTDNLVAPVFAGVIVNNNADTSVAFGDNNASFVGTYSPFAITNANKGYILLLTGGGKLGYSNVARTLGSCRAYFETNGANAAREFVIDFGDETTGIQTIDHSPLTIDHSNGAVYDLQGRKVANGQSSMVNGQLKKGLYIVNGRKFIK